MAFDRRGGGHLWVVWTGIRIVRRSILGLMDTAHSAEDMNTVRQVLHRYESAEVQFHAVRSRQSGARKFDSTHVLVPGHWTVRRGQELLDRIEAEVCAALPEAVDFTRLESLDDPAAWDDETLNPRTRRGG